MADEELLRLRRSYDPRDVASVARTLAMYARLGLDHTTLKPPMCEIVKRSRENCCVSRYDDFAFPVFFARQVKRPTPHWSLRNVLLSLARKVASPLMVGREDVHLPDSWHGQYLQNFEHVAQLWEKHCLHVPIALLKPSPMLRKLDGAAVMMLAQNIKQHGLVNAISVSPRLTVVDGQHRLAAAKLLGMHTIPCELISLVRIYDMIDMAGRRVFGGRRHT